MAAAQVDRVCVVKHVHTRGHSLASKPNITCGKNPSFAVFQRPPELQCDGCALVVVEDEVVYGGEDVQAMGEQTHGVHHLLPVKQEWEVRVLRDALCGTDAHPLLWCA